MHLIHTLATVPFTDNPHYHTHSLVSDLLCCSASDIIVIPSSPISLLLTSNTLNVTLPGMDNSKHYKHIQFSEVCVVNSLTYNNHSVYQQLIVGLTCPHNLHHMYYSFTGEIITPEVYILQ